MPDRTVSERELRESARLVASDLLEKIHEAIANPAPSPEKLEAYANLLSALDGCAAEPG
jgi:hypothetical protein